jgi:hypothetical protein
MDGNHNYWNNVTRKRLSRRHALAVMGSTAAAAAFLAACGGDDDEGGSGTTGGTGSTGGGATGPAGTSGLLITPVEQDSVAKRGGTLNIAGAPATATLEQSRGGSGAGGLQIPNAHSQLMRIKMGSYDETPEARPSRSLPSLTSSATTGSPPHSSFAA